MDDQSTTMPTTPLDTQALSKHIRETRDTAMLNRFLEKLFKVDDPPSSLGNITDWLNFLIAGGCCPEKFAAEVRRYDNASKCGLVWTANFIAYRCRTCGVSPCMSICGNCFHSGQHEGHDFNMFRSKAGGACDCGDISVMRRSGFCSKHRGRASSSSDESDETNPPEELMYMTKTVMPRIFFHLLFYLRTNRDETRLAAGTFADVEMFLATLNEMTNLGAAMRTVLTEILTSRPIYDGQLTDCPPAFVQRYTESKSMLERALSGFTTVVPPPPSEFLRCKGLQSNLKPTTILEEILFWTVKSEFPQCLVCFLLNMLPDPHYKEALMETFILHYNRVALILEQSGDSDTLSNRVVHVSVQLFSNEGLVYRMTKNLDLLPVMVVTLKTMMSKILIRHPITTHSVVDCGVALMNKHSYWPLVSDLCNVLSHRSVAVEFMSDSTLLNTWFRFLAYFQGMNNNRRELNQHVEYEPNTYYAAFSAELEASAYPMWALLSHLTDRTTVPLTMRVLKHCLDVLKCYLMDTRYVAPKKYVQNCMSFHLPLHRWVARFICQAVNVQSVPLKDVLPSAADSYFSSMKKLMMHPLRIQVAFYEIVNDMWVRNGLQIRGQAMTYMQCNFCNSMVDADLYLLQLAAMVVPKEDFVSCLLNKFGLIGKIRVDPKKIPPSSNDNRNNNNNSSSSNINNSPSLTPSANNNNNNDVDAIAGNNADTNIIADPSGDEESKVFASFLQFLATLVTSRVNLGLNLVELTRLEIVTLLCTSDKTHSQLTEQVPERCNDEHVKDFDKILSEVSDYKAPNFELSGGNMQQGSYAPKSFVWERYFDPIHVVSRAAYKRDFQNSMDRFGKYVKTAYKTNNGDSKSTNLWPPFRIPEPCSAAYTDLSAILNSNRFHSFVWFVLYKAIYLKNVMENILSLVVYLLELALLNGSQQQQQQQQSSASTSSSSSSSYSADAATNWQETEFIYIYGSKKVNSVGNRDPPGLWYNGDNLSCNLRTVLKVHSSDLSPPLPSSEVANDDSLKLRALPNNNESSSSTSLKRIMTRCGNCGDNVEEFRYFIETKNEEPPKQEENVGDPDDEEEEGVDGEEEEEEEEAVTEEDNSMENENSSNYYYYGNNIRRNTANNIVEDSIVSLLLKLHSEFSGGKPNSFDPSAATTTNDDLTSRVGDGAAFVKKVLVRIMNLDEACRMEVGRQIKRIWPPHSGQPNDAAAADDETAVDVKVKKEKQLIKERQRKIMATYAQMQMDFMASNEFVDEAMELDTAEGLSSGGSHEGQYDCVICNRSSANNANTIMGMIVLIQATNVLGHRYKEGGGPPLSLPLTAANEISRHRHLSDRFEENYQKRLVYLQQNFNYAYGCQVLDTTWRGGVHVQSCGHYVHVACLNSYLATLRAQQRSNGIDQEEYRCPLCRQLANGVVPLPPDCPDHLKEAPGSPSVTLHAVTNLLYRMEDWDIALASSYAVSMKKTVEDITMVVWPDSLPMLDLIHSPVLFSYIANIARTTLELELIQRGGDRFGPRPNDCSHIKRSCITPLLHVASIQARMLTDWSCLQTCWNQLSGINPDLITIIRDNNTSTILPADVKNAPLIVLDTSMILIQFILSMPLEIHIDYFTCVVRLVFNLLTFQIAGYIVRCQSSAVRNYWRLRPFVGGISQSDGEQFLRLTLDDVIRFTLQALDRTDSFKNVDQHTKAVLKPDMKTVERTFQHLSLPLLRLAAIMKLYIYNSNTGLQSDKWSALERTEFENLTDYLNLNVQLSSSSSQVFVVVGEDVDDSAMSFDLCTANRLETVDVWFRELFDYSIPERVRTPDVFSDNFLRVWSTPKLIVLPREYNVIFHHYQNKVCDNCFRVPEEAGICLLCGTLICLKQSCCKHGVHFEGVYHSISCGSGTAMYLALASSFVVVIRGKRTCLWGSLYLDSFGEEDRDLRRGKPLYLSEQRLQLLEQQWLNHRFDHTNKKWIWHRNAL